MALVKFISCSAAAFTGLAVKDKDTLYFVEDERRLYKGDIPYSGGIYQAVASFPERGAINTLYIHETTGEVKFWNGSAYVQVVKPFTSTLTTDDNTTLPTSKAVADYVTEALKKVDLSSVTSQISALQKKYQEHDASIAKHETAINTTLPASIAEAKKAGDDAAQAVSTLENGKVATNTSDIAKLKTDKANVADVYTKGQTDAKINELINQAGHLKREIVEQLPEVGAANEHTIYMVGTGEGSSTSNYKEYMLINGKFELVGDSSVDLTNYATKTYAETKATEAKNAAIAEATTKANAAKDAAIAAAATDATQKANAAKEGAIAAIDGKVATAIQGLDVADTAVEGQYVSSVSETDGKIKITRAPLPSAATLVEGTENGTVKFNGKDVKVHGLGSAAYANTDAFDSKGAATAAQAEAIKQAKAYVEQLLTWGSVG